MLGGLQRRTDLREKGPESFASMIEKRAEHAEKHEPEPKMDERARTPQKPTDGKSADKVGKNEAGSRTDKDLSVKRKDSGERSDSSAKSSEDDSPRENISEHKAGKSDDEKATLDKPGKGLKRNLSQRQKVMQEFMDSVESEFSIPPERMVEAMTKLNDKEILKAPEETASQIISEMQLPADVSGKVEARYVQMLTKLSDLERHRPEKILEPVGEQLAWLQALGGMAGMGAIASVKPGANGEAPSLVSVKDQKLMLNDSLQQLNQKFFLNSPEALGGDSAQGMGKMEAGAGMGALAAAMSNDGPAAMNNMDPNKAIDPNQVKTQIPGMNGPLKLSSENYQELAAKLATLGMAAGALDQTMKADPANRAALKMEQALQAQASGAGQMDPSAASFMMLAGGSAGQAGDSMSSFSEGKGDKESSIDLGSPGKTMSGNEFMVQQTDSPLLSKAELSSTAAAAGAAVTTTVVKDPSQNIQQIMNQAQYVMKKGGGEAIVKLNPEGLGEVHMKIMVNDGKVSLQMSAETKEAKSLIESSMNDLKASLGTHNLKIDHLKVDVGNQASADANSQGQAGFKFDQGREQARQFLSNFQEDNLSNRSGYFESPALKAYGTSKGPEPLKPSPESARSRRYVGEGRGTGLNLVA
jgi:flagellar hook-length control protein FliK